MQRIKIKADTSLSKWSLEKAREVYNIREWGKGFFDINEKGNITVSPDKDKRRYIDLRELVEDLRIRGISAPMLLRFTDILRKRIEEVRALSPRPSRNTSTRVNITASTRSRLTRAVRWSRT